MRNKIDSSYPKTLQLMPPTREKEGTMKPLLLLPMVDSKVFYCVCQDPVFWNRKLGAFLLSVFPPSLT